MPQNNFNYVHFINNKLLVFIKVNYNSLGVSSIVLDKNKKYWLSTGKIGADRSIICEDGNKELSYSPMARIPRTDVSNFFIDENDILWIITNNALFRYDSKIKINEEKNFHVVFNRIKSKTDSIIFDCRFYNDKIKKRGYFTKFSVYQPKNLIPSIEYEDNSITIEYSATIFESDKIEFQYFLKGFDDEWSEWKKERKKEYTNLSEGSYIFKIRARNIFGTVSEISSLKFKIKSPWYRSVFAVIFYILFFVERTLEISKQKDEINMRNHEITKKSKEVLWQTKKLEKINSDLTEKNKETNKQNKEMKDNIQYALITQKIILPNQKELNKEFENFVIFKAKNIISGDFYWFQKEKNKMFFAVADCSGHSINGGFITIIANHILTKVVKKDKVYDTNLILEKTYENFKKAIEEYKNIDEALIKIALICIEKLENNKTKISFSGAKLSLWYFNNENLKILKADRRSISIGGSYKKSNKIDFTKEEIILNKNDIIYFFTDGFLNQNAKNRKKFGSEKLKKILQKNINLPLYEQKEKLDAAFLRHKQEEEQRDDITVIAIKF
ncbi:MAG: hypothetical protein B6I24_01495 [Bacteroidetes bacterium 4572_128]|nr:MAG: hypothetical protein B6I24_01495 [Bacteroidetes bacterium 4572_128]